MEKKTKEVKIIIDYPPPQLTPKEEAELKSRLESHIVHNFPELSNKGKVVVVSQPKHKVR